MRTQQYITYFQFYNKTLLVRKLNSIARQISTTYFTTTSSNCISYTCSYKRLAKRYPVKPKSTGAVAILPVIGFDGILIYIGTIAIPIYSTFIIGLISPPHPQNVYDMLHRIMYLLYHNVLYQAPCAKQHESRLSPESATTAHQKRIRLRVPR